MAAAAVSSHTHPRRRAANPDADSLTESLANMSLRKGLTFHSPAINDSDLLDPFENLTLSVPRSMTARSITCPKELEDLLVGAGERRVVDFLARVDEAVNNKSKEQLGSILNQAYDSGLGSSISDSDEGTIKIEDDNKKTSNRPHKSPRSGSAITRSISSVGSDHANANHLSQFAVEQIHRYLIKPILNEPALKDFHKLVHQVPRRIGDRQITNLRDLEKTLIFLAPDYSRSPAAYLQFCETSIHCLHATANGVHDSDQRLPTDRPYTNHYFLDLVQQIRRYAQILAANRKRQAAGEDVDDMEMTPSHLEFRDGMTQTGRPAQLGYRTKGQLISLANNQPLPLDAAPTVSAKRPMSDDFVDDDGVERSMARRKKGELPKTYTCPVGDCDKIFNRPCDRTKHLKTHERPHKCSEERCEFKTKGFPTEKERDRHWSDRHDPAAKQWDCQWKESGCPYSSKREHNLKSHMEKAHGWEYLRSKGVKNSSKPVKPVTKVKAKAKTPIGPRDSVTSSSSASTPFTLHSTSPATFGHPSSSTSPASLASNQMNPSPVESLMDYNHTSFFPTTGFNPDFADHFNTTIFGTSTCPAPPSAFPYTPSLSDGHRPSHISSLNGTPLMPIQNDFSFEDIPAHIPPTPNDLDFSNSIFSKEWNLNQGQSGVMGSGDDFIMYGDESNYLYDNGDTFEQPMQTHVHTGIRNDPTLTDTQSYSLPADEGLGNFGAQDFILEDYLSNTGVSEPLFDDDNNNGGFGEMGSQFNLDKSADEPNVYQQWFPEVN